MKIALSQMDIQWEDKPTNYKKAEILAKAAYAVGAELFLLPEMSFTGFSMHTQKTAESYPYPSVQHMQRVSLDCPGMAIGFGYAAWTKADNDKAGNCLEVVRDGASVLHYEKIHPFTFGEEGKYFGTGEQLGFCKAGDMTISGFICYDLRFPEVFQAASKTSELIFVIANWPKERAAHWKLLLQARAVENQCYIAGINRIGEGGGLLYEPGTFLFGPDGTPVEGRFFEGITLPEGMGCGNREGFYLMEVDREKVQAVREVFPLKADRREALYARWYAAK